MDYKIETTATGYNVSLTTAEYTINLAGVGAQGGTGQAGASAYDAAVEGGYTGTEEEFHSLLASIQVNADAADESAGASATSASESAASAEEAQAAAGLAAGSAVAAGISADTATIKANDASLKATEASGSATMAREWATKEAGEVVAGLGYSSKKYAEDSAGSSADAAEKATQSATSATQSATSASLAQQWATKDNAEVVIGQGYSAKKHAQDSATKAAEAATSAGTSVTQAGIATTKAAEAADSKDGAVAAQAGAVTAAETSTTQAGISTAKATEAAGSAMTAKDWATKASDEVVPGQGYSAKKYAQDADQSADNSAASAVVATDAAASIVGQVSLAQQWATKETGEVVTGQGYSAKKYAADAAESSTESFVSAEGAATSASMASTKAAEALGSADSAEVSSTKAGKWANEDVNVPVEPGQYSAKHWALAAQQSAVGALIYRGPYTASLGVYPANPALGDYYRITDAGVIDGIDYAAGDSIICNGSGWDKIDSTDEVTSVAGRVGNVTLTAEDVGLGEVDNTSDADKPISTAQQQALDLKASAADVAPISHVGSGGTAHANATPTVSGFMSAADKARLNEVVPSAVTPAAPGSAAPGVSLSYAREDHVHPVQTSVTGNAGTSTKLATGRTVTVGDTSRVFDGTADIGWTVAQIGAAPAAHTHPVSEITGAIGDMLKATYDPTGSGSVLHADKTPWGGVEDKPTVLAAGATEAEARAAIKAAALGSDGKLVAEELPPAVYASFWVAASPAQLVNLPLAKKGDFCNVMSARVPYMLTAMPATDLNNWMPMATPLTSVAGRTGVVTLTKADVGLEQVDNTSDAAKPVSTAQAEALAAKQDTLVSQGNIRSINGTSILGSGDLLIVGAPELLPVVAFMTTPAAAATVTIGAAIPSHPAGLTWAEGQLIGATTVSAGKIMRVEANGSKSVYAEATTSLAGKDSFDRIITGWYGTYLLQVRGGTKMNYTALSIQQSSNIVHNGAYLNTALGGLNYLSTTNKTSIVEAINELVAGKQAALVSGSNIKSINGTSIVGSGDVSVQWKAVDIPSSANMDTYQTEGAYVASTSLIAASLSNSPTAIAFSLRVWKSAGVVQEVTEFSANNTRKTYQRAFALGVWSAWARIYTTIDVPTKAAVGLGSVDNTTDADKPVSTAQQAALNLKANLASPALTGTPTAPTADSAVNNTQLATTAFVQAVNASDTGSAATAVALKTSRTINGVPFNGTEDITIPVATTMPTFSYDNRNSLRTLTGDYAVVESLGLFGYKAGIVDNPTLGLAAEVDDDESCFATSTGRWLLLAIHWDLLDAWQSTERAARDIWEAGEAERTSAAIAAATPIAISEAIAAKFLKGTATCAITSVGVLSSASFTGTVIGAAIGDTVIATPPAALEASNVGRLSYSAWVSAADTVTIALSNSSASGATTNPAIRVAWPVMVIK